MWRLPKPGRIDLDPELPPEPLPEERMLIERWEREAPERVKALRREGKLLQAIRNALSLQERMELELRAQNPGMTPMEADQHTRHVLSPHRTDPS